MSLSILAVLALSSVWMPSMTRNSPKLIATPFPLEDIRLEGGPWLTMNKACAAYLLEIDPDRLLHSFRIHSGLDAKAPIYGGWEDSGLAGHTLGHYLSACSQQYAETGDARFKQKVDYIVEQLTECQKNRPDGYISAIPNGDKAWAEIKAGNIRSGGFDLNGMWSPWYTNHKILAGLLDANKLTGSTQALTVAEKFADWAIEETKGLDAAQWQKMLGCEYGGMNESLAELYARTGQQKYLDLSRKFYDDRVLDPLSEGVDDLAGKHSNTQIPKIIGLARLYELTGDTKDEKTARFFWDSVVRHHTYAIGGNSNGEYLGPPDKLNDKLSSNTCETCNTYNMLKLTRHLFSWSPNAEEMDFYERAYFNHILASQDPDTAGMTYFMPLASGSHREFSDKWNTFTCCHGSGLENQTKHGDTAYFHEGADKLWVNLFMPTELSWHEAGLKIRQDTRFPADGKVTLSIVSGKPHLFAMLVRHPGWAAGPVEFLVNGKVIARSTTPSSYVSLSRTWKPGDKLEFTLPMSLHTEAMPDNPKRVAMLYGPMVLAADLGSADGPAPRIPVLVTNDQPISQWLKPGVQPGEFISKGVGRPSDLTFEPFYTLRHDRYAVYFDEFTEDQWKAAEAEYRANEARVKDLEARTVDFMRVGEMQPERDHQLKSDRNDVRDVNGRPYRTPLNGGWFEVSLKVDSDKQNSLVATYWGNDRIHPDFRILVDGKEIATDKLSDRPLNKFFDQTYPIPADLTHGKTQVTVRIEALDGQSGPSVSGLRMVREK